MRHGYLYWFRNRKGSIGGNLPEDEQLNIHTPSNSKTTPSRISMLRYASLSCVVSHRSRCRWFPLGISVGREHQLNDSTKAPKLRYHGASYCTLQPIHPNVAAVFFDGDHLSENRFIRQYICKLNLTVVCFVCQWGEEPQAAARRDVWRTCSRLRVPRGMACNRRYGTHPPSPRHTYMPSMQPHHAICSQF